MVPPGTITLDSLAKVLIVLAGGVQVVTDYVRRHATTSQSANDIPFHAGVLLIPLYSSTHAKSRSSVRLRPSSILPTSENTSSKRFGE
jgi:hypothetical protein